MNAPKTSYSLGSQADYFLHSSKSMQGEFFNFSQEFIDDHLYGFNGMEKDDEVSGSGNSYDFGARFYNPRVGRWLSGDPHEKRYPGLSAYSSNGNNPIIFIDPDGRDIIYFDINGNYKCTVKASGADVYKQEAAVFDQTMSTEGASVEVGRMSSVTLDYDNPLILSYVKQNQSWHDYVNDLEVNGVWSNLSEKQRTNILDAYGADFNKRRWEEYGKGSFAMALWPLALVGAEAILGELVAPAVAGGIVTGEAAVALALKYGPKVYRSLQRGNWERGRRQLDRWMRKQRKQNGCFVEGTLILMADGSFRKIENIQQGDFVLTFNEDTQELEVKEVLQVGMYKNSQLVTIHFGEDVTNTNTLNHPYFVLDKGWCSISPSSTFDAYGIIVDSLRIGDTCLYYNVNKAIFENIIITEIVLLDSAIWTYNLDEVEDNHNFIANQILVHNKAKRSKGGRAQKRRQKQENKDYSERGSNHTKNQRQSNKKRHEGGESRRQMDKGGEKGDVNRPYKKTDSKK